MRRSARWRRAYASPVSATRSRVPYQKGFRRRASHFTSATNPAASGGSLAIAVASMGAVKLGLSPATCPASTSPRVQTEGCPGSRLDGHEGSELAVSTLARTGSHWQRLTAADPAPPGTACGRAAHRSTQPAANTEHVRLVRLIAVVPGTEHAAITQAYESGTLVTLTAEAVSLFEAICTRRAVSSVSICWTGISGA